MGAVNSATFNAFGRGQKMVDRMNVFIGGLGVIIPPERLTMEALRGIVESFIVREGTDYGAQELSLNEKVEALLPQVVRGDVVIFFDEESESVNLLPREEAEIA